MEAEIGANSGTPTDDADVERRWTMVQLRNRLELVLLPIVVIALALLAWQAAIVLFEIKPYLAPAPLDVFRRILDDADTLAFHLSITAFEAITGFLIAALVGIPLGFAIAASRIVERALYPLLVVIELTPKIAFAPLLLVWFGFGVGPKLFIVFLMTFFPIVVSSFRGFKALDPRMLYITESMGASNLQALRYIRIQSALPEIFTGLRLSVVVAGVGAIVAEFIGASQGLGYVLLRATTFLDTTAMFAALVLLASLGIGMSYAVAAVEYLLMPWNRKGAEPGE